MLIPIAYAQAPSYEIIQTLTGEFPNYKIDYLQLEVNGMELDTPAFTNKCYPHSKVSTTCDYILIYQNEKIIEQNQQIIDLLTIISQRVQ